MSISQAENAAVLNTLLLSPDGYTLLRKKNNIKSHPKKYIKKFLREPRRKIKENFIFIFLILNENVCLLQALKRYYEVILKFIFLA